LWRQGKVVGSISPNNKMPDENLVKYIKDGLAQGRTEDILRPMLASAGWAQKDVDDAFNFVKMGRMPVAAVPMQSVEQPSTPQKVGSTTPDIPSGGFFSELFKIYRSRIWVSLALIVIPVVLQVLVMVALYIVVLSLGLGGLLLFHLNGSYLILLVIPLALTFTIFDVWVQCIFILALFNTNLRYEEKLGVFASMRSMPRKAWSFVLISIISTVLLGGAFILAIIPGIFLTIAFFLTVPVLIVEGQTGLNALLRSRDLTKGHWWYTFWRLLGTMVIVLVSAVVLEMVGAALASKFSFIIGLIVIALGYLIGFLAYPLIPAATAVLFRKFQAERPEIVPSSSGRKWKYAALVLPWILLVTLGVMGGLSGIGRMIFPASYSPTSQSSSGGIFASGSDVRRISDLQEMQTALEIYYTKCGFYPGSANCAAQPAPASWSDLGTALIGSNLGVTQIPNDPSGGSATYTYGVNGAGTSYILEATLEDPSDIPASYTPPVIPAGMAWTSGTVPTCTGSQYCLAFVSEAVPSNSAPAKAVSAPTGLPAISAQTDNWVLSKVSEAVLDDNYNSIGKSCFSFRHPPGFEGVAPYDQEFVDANGTEIVANFTQAETLQDMEQSNLAAGFSEKDFTTQGGLEGKEFIRGDYEAFFIPTVALGKPILITIVPAQSTATAPLLDIGTMEAVAKSVVSPCSS
jgi:hypothetical protein